MQVFLDFRPRSLLLATATQRQRAVAHSTRGNNVRRPKMLVIGHIALAAWTAGPAAPVHAASRSRPVIAAAEVSVTAAMDRRDDDSSSASLPPSFPLTAHGPRTGPCSFSLAILALATSARPPSRGPSTCVVPSVKTRQLIPRVRRAQGRRRRLAGRPLTTRRRAWRSTGKTRALC